MDAQTGHGSGPVRDDKPINYDTLSSEYAKHRKVHPNVLPKILEAARKDKTTAILEVGCGTGNYISAVQSTLGCACYGVDPSEKMLNVARQQNPLVSYQVGRGEELRFADNAFTLVFSVDVIHHIVSRADYYRQAYRVLQWGATICTMTESEPMIRQRLHSQYFPDTIAVELMRYPSLLQLANLMREAGFVGIHEQAVRFMYQVIDIQPYRDKAFSSLHYVSDEAFRLGIERMERDLLKGPLQAVSEAILLWGTRALR